MSEKPIVFKSLEDMINMLPRYCNGSGHLREKDVLTCIRIWEEKQDEYSENKEEK